MQEPSPNQASRPRRILHAFNQHRGGGGADNAARATIDICRRHGWEIEVFTKDSEQLPKNLVGRIRAGTSALYAPGPVREFARLLDSFRPDLVHIHEVFPLVTPWILPLSTRRNVPVVMTCVDYRLTCPIVTHLRNGQICRKCLNGRPYWALLRNCRENLPESLTVASYNLMTQTVGLFRRHVGLFIAPSEFTHSWLAEEGGIDPRRIRTVFPLVEVPETPADAAGGDYVAFAGRFTPEKGIDTLLEAAKITGLPFCLSRSVNARVTMSIPDSVRVVVTHNRSELDAFYRRARMLVFPSIWFETFGLVGAEAMSLGIPVVASRLGAMQGLVEDGVDGLLFNPGDPHDLSAKIARLWSDPDLCRRLGRAGRQKALRLWAPERHFSRIQEVYGDLCA